MILLENQLRTYIACPKLYSYNKEYDISIEKKFFLHALQYLISTSLRESYLDPALQLTKSLSSAKKQFPSVSKDVIFNTATNINILLNHKALIRTQPIFSIIETNTTIANTNINFNIIGMFSNGSNYTTVIIFSPYETYHGIINDYLNDLKIQAVNNLLKDTVYRHQIKYLCIGLNNKNQIIITERNKEYKLEHIKHIINNIEQKQYYPILPCVRQCKYIGECKP